MLTPLLCVKKKKRGAFNRKEAKSVKETDVFTVRHFTDAPSTTASYTLFVFLEVMEKTPEAETRANFGKLSIPLSELLYFRKKYGINAFPFHYEEKNGDPMHTYTEFLFTLVFE